MDTQKYHDRKSTSSTNFSLTNTGNELLVEPKHARKQNFVTLAVYALVFIVILITIGIVIGFAIQEHKVCVDT